MRSATRFITLHLLAFTILTAGAAGATIYWDTNGATAGAGNPADGTWDVATTTNWTSDSAGTSATTVYTQASDIVFSAGTDTATAAVTVSNADGTPTVTSITFKNGATTLSGNNFDDAGVTIQYTVEDGASGVVNQADGPYNANFDIQGAGTLLVNVVRGGSVMSKTGTGTLTLNRLDGYFTVDQGLVIYTGTVSAKLKSATINDTATLRIQGLAFDGSRPVTVNTGGTFQMDAGVVEDISTLNGAGTVTGGAGADLTVTGGTFSGNIIGDMGLSKSGTGTTTLSGANTYSGGTTVSAGTISVSGAGTLGAGNVIVQAPGALTLGGDSANQSISDTASLLLYEDSGDYAIVNLNQDETVGALFFNDVQQVAGTWGATGSGAAHINDSYFTGSSILTVIPEPTTVGLLALGAAALIRRRR